MGATGIERKPLVCPGPAKPPVHGFGLEDYDLFSLFMEEPPKGDAGESSPEYCSSHWLLVYRLDLYW